MPRSQTKTVSSRQSRRRFLQKSAVGGLAALAAPRYLKALGPSDQLRIAIIGCRGRGAANLAGVESESIVALCDLNQFNLDAAAEKHNKAARFSDFRRMFDQANLFDAVVVSTCEHTHAFATLPALQLGKHVYCEKPLAHSVWESRVIREAAAKTKLATQIGTQIHAGRTFHEVVEIIQAGVIGGVREVHVWVDRSRGWHPTPEDAQKNKDDEYTVQERPTEVQPIPSGLDWDLWLGPAPARPFHTVYWPGPRWYRWWDFGGGTMSDLGAHWIDLPFWALGLKHPLTVEAKGAPPHPEMAPAALQVAFEFGPRGDAPPVTLHWYQGVGRPDLSALGKIPSWPSGALFVGEKGMLLANYSKFVLLPEKEFADFSAPKELKNPPPKSHHAEWIQACKTGSPTSCNFEYAGWLAESNHLGNVAYRVGKKLEWNAAEMKATNAPEADRILRREYRAGWSLT